MAVLEGYEDLGDFQDDDFVDMGSGDEYVEPAGDEPVDETNALDAEDVDETVDATPDSGTASVLPDELKWMDGLNPEHVRNSWEKFTQGQQELAAERARLQPFEQLYEELANNPRLQAYIQQFDWENQGTGDAPKGFDPKLVELENEVNILRTERQVEKDWNALQETIRANGYPEVKQDDVIQYMIDNQIPKMDAAYRAMTYDSIRAKTEESTLENIKKNRQAALPKAPKTDKGGKSQTTMADIMDDDKFFSEYGSLVRGLVG